MVELEHEPNGAVANLCKLRGGKPGQLLPHQANGAGGGHVECANAVKQRALASAALAHNGEHFACLDVEVDAVQHGEVTPHVQELFVKPSNRDDGLGRVL